MVFPEANSYGVPVITTDTGGVADVVHEGVNGHLLPIDARADAYADLLETVRGQGPLRRIIHAWSLGAEADGWSHPVYTLTPGIPGDSGSAFLDGEGNALGTLSTLALAPLAGSNGVGDVAHELAYAKANSGISGLALEPGTEPFSPVL